MAGFGALSDNDKANLILKKTSFRDLLAKNPSGDTIRTVLTVKGDWFFNLSKIENRIYVNLNHGSQNTLIIIVLKKLIFRNLMRI